MSVVAIEDPIAIMGEWIFATLSTDTTLAALGIHEDEVPEGEPLPAVVYQWRGGATLRGVGTAVLWEGANWLVKVVGQGRSTAALSPYSTRVNAKLHGASGTTAAGRVFMCAHQSAYKHAEYTDGEYYRHLGAYWRILAR